jgi:hypothetical protein
MVRRWASFHYVWVVLAALAALVPTRLASAQSPQETALARSLFEQGVALADQGQWLEAADRFRRAYTLKPTPGLAFNLASALGEAGKFVEACELLEQLSRDGSLNADLQAEVAAKLELLSPRRAHLTVQVEAESTDDVTVEIDGQPWPRVVWGVPVPVDPGTHSVVGRASPERVSEGQISLAEGERATHVVALPTLAPHAEPQAEPARSFPRETERRHPTPLHKRWALWAGVGAVVVAGVVLGVVLARPDSTTEAPIPGNAGVITW